ncbi:YfgM family protein [Rosenbergiella australiborealis]|uniref:YfgM family protein n=1 Tax=Rosenbergiella australiborealis TaxID=1544696 RepID=UPI001F4F00C3
MEVYSNDNQRDQTEVVKQFFANNGKALAIGAVIGVAALVGWRFWVNHQQNDAQASSERYQQLTTMLKADNPASIQALGSFVEQDKNSYGALASLTLAKTFVDKNDLPNAEKQLVLGLQDSSDQNLQAVIRLRLARIQSELKTPDEALKTLDAVKGDNWTGIAADIRGDILLSKGDKQGAAAAWREGIKSEVSPALKQMMQTKLNNFS